MGVNILSSDEFYEFCRSGRRGTRTPKGFYTPTVFKTASSSGRIPSVLLFQYSMLHTFVHKFLYIYSKFVRGKMPSFTDKEIAKMIREAEESALTLTRRKREPTSSDVRDDENNPDVPKGGKWGITGAGQTPEMFRTRVGSPGLATSPSGKVKDAETQNIIKRIKQVEPDELIAYSRGASLYNAARAAGLDGDTPVTYMAPSSYRHWSTAPVPKVNSGSKVIIGDDDSVIPMKQAARNAVEAGDIPMYVLPGFSHTGIMYSHGDLTPGSFEVDAKEILQDPEMPDWGSAGVIPGGKGGDALQQQKEKVKDHVKEELRRMVRKIVREMLEPR